MLKVAFLHRADGSSGWYVVGEDGSIAPGTLRSDHHALAVRALSKLLNERVAA